MPQAELRVVSGKHSGNKIPLPVGKFLIGREEDCHLRPNSDLISRHHCVFTLDDYGLRLRDLGSTNGSFVNGERLQGSVILNTGDQVKVGKLEFEVTVGDPLSDETQTNMAAGTQTEIIQTASPQENSIEDDSHLLAEIFDEMDDETDAPSASETMINIPVEPPPGFENQPPPQTGDTQYFLPQMPPPGYPPGYPPQMGYPQQMMPYGYPPPGYPQMGYPQQPVGYPPGYMPQQYPQAPPQPQQEEPPAKDSKPELAVRLPNPSETGVKAPAPVVKDPNEKQSAEAKAKEEAPSAAANAIQQYLQRRPGGKK